MTLEAGTVTLSSEKLSLAFRSGRTPRPPDRSCGDIAQRGDETHGSADDRHPALGRCMTLDMLTNLPEPRSPHLQNGNKNSSSPGDCSED